MSEHYDGEDAFNPGPAPTTSIRKALGILP